MYNNSKYDKWREAMPNEYPPLNYTGGTRHINNAEMYRNAVNNLKWANRKGNGERWTMDDIIKRSNINFNEENFTPYDYAYIVNALYADYGNASEKYDNYMQMGKDYLHNDNFPERASERAYYDAQRRYARRNNSYNNYNNAYNYTNRYDDGMNYRNSYGDRDDDGRYYE